MAEITSYSMTGDIITENYYKSITDRINEHLFDSDIEFYVATISYCDSTWHRPEYNVLCLCMNYTSLALRTGSAWWPYWELSIDHIKLVAHKLNDVAIALIVKAIMSDKMRTINLSLEDKVWVISKILGEKNE